MDDRPHALYRFYAAGGALLYVGITHSPGQRWGKHREDKPWWSEVVSITLEQHPDREAVLLAERQAIATEKPRYNVVHNRPTSTVRPSPAELMPDMCHDWCVRQYDDNSVYFPHRWSRGRAEYACVRGHKWTCWWPEMGTGTASIPPRIESPSVARRRAEWLASLDHRESV